MKSYKLCPYCDQPMLPDGEAKKPNEYDHAMGCPLKEARERLEAAAQVIDRLDILKDLEQGLAGTVAGETIYEGKRVIDLVREDIAKAEGKE